MNTATKEKPLSEIVYQWGMDISQLADTVHCPIIFSSREELIRKGFMLFGEDFTADEILDQCSEVWLNYSENNETTSQPDNNTTNNIPSQD